MKKQHDTRGEFTQAKALCRDIFEKKLKDYGTSWHIMRPKSITDQILIKAMRIRTLEETSEAKVDEGILPEFIGIVNYAMIGLIQLQTDCDESLSNEKALQLYDCWLEKTTALMMAKNHDYGEAWRIMLTSSYTDIILQKLHRTREIQANNGKTLISEGVDANYMDMANYALFGIIKLTNE